MAGDSLVYVVDSNGSLATINLTTGAVAIVGKPSVHLTSIAFSPTGQLYGTDGKSLYTVNSTNESTTKVGDFGGTELMSDIRFAGNGTLYAEAAVLVEYKLPDGTLNPTGDTNGVLYVVNPQTGAATQIGLRGIGYDARIGGLTFADGHLYQSWSVTHYGFFGTINPTTDALISSTPPDLSGDFTGPNDTLYSIGGGNINTVNPATGSTTQVATFSNADLGAIYSIASPMDAAPQGKYYVADGTTGAYTYEDGSNYGGPVPGLTSEFVTNTSDVLDVTALVPSAFIEVGYVPGQQTPPSEGGINVSYANGNNVLDGYAGSNFLTGGSGSDTFYVDDRTLTQNSWSTVVNFHGGDGVTMWGVTAADFATALDGKGATGYTGLTLVFNAGKQTAAVTMAGYTSADLFNGRLDVSYGSTAAIGSVPGATYMHIQGG